MKKIINSKNVFWALIFAISFPISVYCLSNDSLSGPIAFLIIAINVLLFGIYAIKQIYTVKSLDEVQIRIQLEAVSIAFVLSLVLVMLLGMLGTVKSLGVNCVSYLFVFPLFFLFYFVGLFISNNKYR